MSTYILRLDGTSIIGGRPAVDNAVIPDDSREVSKEVYNDWENAKLEMRADGRTDKPQLISDVVVIPADIRPEISVTFNKTAYKIDQLATVTIDVIDNTTYSQNRIYNQFNSHYLFQFAGGTVTRSDVGFVETGVFEIKSGKDFKVINPQDITIYR